MKTSGVGEVSPVGVLALSVGEAHQREAHRQAHRQQHEGRAARGAQSREHPDFAEHSLEEGGSRQGMQRGYRGKPSLDLHLHEHGQMTRTRAAAEHTAGRRDLRTQQHAGDETASKTTPQTSREREPEAEQS